METKTPSNEERNSLITRFILMFVVSLLCAIIPLYFLFSLPDKAINKLNARGMSIKAQKEKVERLKTLIADLDKFWKEKNFGKEYTNSSGKLYNFAKDSIDESDINKFVYVRISDIYDSIQKAGEGTGGNENEELKKLKEDKTKLETDLAACQKDLKEKNDMIINSMKTK
ncbi:MAG: hypothetical protein NTU44_06315 [Bacteroidetes bacterium]|nr:hypothetical protein [Bacteroidota bacterium]